MPVKRQLLSELPVETSNRGVSRTVERHRNVNDLPQRVQTSMRTMCSKTGYVFMASGKKVYSCRDKNIKLEWEMQSNIILIQVLANPHCLVLVATRSGEWLILNLDHKAVCVFKLMSNEHMTAARVVKTSCMEFQFVAGFASGIVRIWNISVVERKVRVILNAEYEHSKSSVTSLLTRHNLVFSSCWEGKIHVWDNNLKQLRRVIKRKFGSSIIDMSFYKEDIVTVHYDGTLTLFRFPDFNARKLKVKKNGPPQSSW